MAFICPHCGAEHRDGTDERAEKRGHLSYAEAARRLGYSTTWVKGKIRAGLLRTTEFAGRQYVDADSVDRLLGHEGFPDPAQQRLEYLESIGRGNSYEAGAIREGMILADQARNREMGVYPTSPESAARTVDDAPNPVAAFVAKYLPGGVNR